MEVRLLVDPPADGAWNMAVDEALLHTAASGGPATWRFYQWREPTLSLGYFQAAAECRQAPAAAACPRVRRASGGGALVHDWELTYSFACGVGPTPREALDWYERIHAVLIDTLHDLGIAARRCVGGRKPAAGEPFLCFQRRAAGDVLCGEAKIAGSAQRRRRGGLLQHGGVLLDRSEAAPALPGVNDLTGATLTAEMLSNAWRRRLERHLGWRFQSAPLTAAEVALATQWAAEKFAHPAWTNRR